MHEPLALSLHNKSGSTRELHAPNARLQNREQEVREESTRRYFSRTRTKKTDKRSNEERSSKLSQGVPPPQKPPFFSLRFAPNPPSRDCKFEGIPRLPIKLNAFPFVARCFDASRDGRSPTIFSRVESKIPLLPETATYSPIYWPPAKGDGARSGELAETFFSQSTKV